MLIYKYSIVIDIVNFNLFLSTTAYGLNKFLDTNCIDTIFLIGDVPVNAQLERIYPNLKDKLTWLDSKYNFLTVSKLIKTQIYLCLSDNHILKKPLTLSDLATNGEINCNLESFPHGTLSWTTNRNDWFTCWRKMGGSIGPEIYTLKCMTLSPQIFITELALEISSFTEKPVVQFYWFYISQKKINVYTENKVLWNPELSHNAMHSTVPIDYLYSNVTTGCKNSSKFIVIDRTIDISEQIFSEISKPTRSQLMEFMDQLVLYNISEEKLGRLGDNGDGGYLLYMRDTSPTILYGYGLGTSYKFEEDYTQTFKTTCVLYDHTVSPEIPNPNVRHRKIGLDHYSHGEFDTLESQIRKNGHWGKRDLCLKMDVEGYEWFSLLFATDECLNHFEQIILELHHLHTDYHGSITQKTETLKKLNKNFYLVHVHGNNCKSSVNVDGFEICPVLEVTFVRKDLFSEVLKVKQKPVLPVKLDRPNDRSLKEIVLSTYYPYNT